MPFDTCSHDGLVSTRILESSQENDGTEDFHKGTLLCTLSPSLEEQAQRLGLCDTYSCNVAEQKETKEDSAIEPQRVMWYFSLSLFFYLLYLTFDLLASGHFVLVPKNGGDLFQRQALGVREKYPDANPRQHARDDEA